MQNSETARDWGTKSRENTIGYFQFGVRAVISRQRHRQSFEFRLTGEKRIEILMYKATDGQCRWYPKTRIYNIYPLMCVLNSNKITSALDTKSILPESYTFDSHIATQHTLLLRHLLHQQRSNKHSERETQRKGKGVKRKPRGGTCNNSEATLTLQ